LVEISPEHVVLEKLRDGSFEKYLREHSITDKSKESQVAIAVPFLEYLGIVEVNPQKPSKLRLKKFNLAKYPMNVNSSILPIDR
jgi:hypothetical protein